MANPSSRLTKVCGADIELSNFILGFDRPGGTGYEASRALLREIDGLPRAWVRPYPYAADAWGSWDYRDRSAAWDRDSTWRSAYDEQDWGRKFLPTNGGCVYIDLDHLELCLPEVRSAWDHVAAWHAMLRVARQALEAANAHQPPGRKIQALVNNSDGQGNSYGSHLNFLITRRAWDDLFTRKLHQLQYLATFQVSSIVLTGQGKVGAENGTPPAAYQLSQRADFLETLSGIQTTSRRPIVNSRDEPLCGWLPLAGDGGAPARLHVICFDNTLAHGSSLLKVGTMQVMLAMIEAGRMDPSLILDDPVEAVVRFSHDPSLQAKAPLASCRSIGAVELQRRFLEAAVNFAASGGLDDVVPRAPEILAFWEDTLVKLEARDLAALAPRLDWVLKLQMLERAMRQGPELEWESSQVKLLDHLYSSLALDDGLYWAYERTGFTERLVTEEEIQKFLVEAPADTRAWTRAKLLQSAPPESVESVDWDSITFNFRGRGYWPVRRTVTMGNPLAFTKAEMAPLFGRAESVDQWLDAVEASGERSGEGAPGDPPGLAACRPPLPWTDSSPVERSRCHEIP